jgi:transcriptional regulator with XRE-family HTH domain
MRKSVYSEGQTRLQQLLTAARKEAKLTQQEVADRLDRHQSFVAKYEGGERRLDVVEFVAVARALESDPKRLLANLIADAGL